MRYISFLCLIAALALVLVSCAKEETTETTQKTYTIGILLTGRPFAFQDASGELMGIEPELLRQIAKDEGFELVLKTVPSREELYAEVIDGTLTAGIGKLVREETDMETPYHYSDPYMSSYQTVLVRPDSDLRRLADLEGRRVGVQQGTRADEVISAREGIFVRRYEHGTQAVEALLNGDLEAVVMENHSADEVLARHEDQLEEFEDTLAMVNYAMVCRRDEFSVHWEFNSQLLRLRGTGFVSALREKYAADLLEEL